jgi:hypothetical protein
MLKISSVARRFFRRGFLAIGTVLFIVNVLPEYQPNGTSGVSVADINGPLGTEVLRG